MIMGRLAQYTSVLIAGIIVLSAFSVEGDGKGQKRPKINHHKMVHAHNVLREAVGVPHLHWSHELADQAQEWADSLAGSCSVFKSSEDYGENMFWTAKNRSEEDVVGFWAKEKKWFDQSDSTFSEEKSDRFEHYSQIIWEGTTHIGAGKQKCKNGDEIWVCFYTPRGNILGEKPF